MRRWYESPHIFNTERGLRGYAFCCQEFVQRRAEELSVDQEFERYGLLGLQKAIDEGGESIPPKT